MYMQLFSCQNREQHISKRKYEIINLEEEIYTSRLKLQRWSFSTYNIYLGFGSVVWPGSFVLLWHSALLYGVFVLDITADLICSKPAHYQLSHALP
jgi:hypothetical protein